MYHSNFLTHIKQSPDTVRFSECIDYINKNYHFTNSSFTNGNQCNEAGQNNGSCKIFAFAQLQKLTQQQTLSCFGEYYRHDVLENPQAEDHQNIRQFMLNGWPGIKFDGNPLTPR